MIVEIRLEQFDKLEINEAGMPRDVPIKSILIHVPLNEMSKAELVKLALPTIKLRAASALRQGKIKEGDTFDPR